MSTDADNPEWQKIEHVLGSALELPEEQREAYLARQPAQIRGEVQSLLAAHRRASSFLGTGTDLEASAGSVRKFIGIEAGTELGP
jgi:hypothetical protein